MSMTYALLHFYYYRGNLYNITTYSSPCDFNHIHQLHKLDKDHNFSTFSKFIHFIMISALFAYTP